MRLICTAAAAVLFSAPAFAQQPSAAAGVFEKRCYSCHNIGGGDKKGPDLKGVTTRQSTEWLREFIKAPAAVNRKGDSVATGLFKKFAPEVMPDQDLADEQIDAIIGMIDGLTKKNEAFVPAGAKLNRPIAPGDVEAGYQLFTGRAALSGGGSACISCHNVSGSGRLGGGTLGPDLSAVNVRYKDPELISILQNPNFPTMKSIFGTRPLNDEEIVKLFAYFQNAKLVAPIAPAPAASAAVRIEPWFVALGFAALLMSLALMNRAWKGRLRGVREELVRRNQ